jgi:TolB-like protein
VAGNLFEELKRRKVFKVGAAYAVVAWLAVQGASIAFPAFEAPAWAMRVFIFVALLGLPVALVLAWVLEATPGGVRVDPARKGTRAMIAVAAVLAIAAIGWFVAPTLRGTPPTATAPIAKAVDQVATAAAPANTASAQSIAVLPFDNLSSDPEQAYFSDGLSEDLITALSQAGGLKVISRNSSFRFRDTRQAPGAIGQALGVARLLSGSVRRAGAQVRISATLTDVADGRTLWSKKYDRPYADLFALQDEITAEVAHELHARLLPAAAGGQDQSDRPPSGNLEAYNAFLQGRFHAERTNPEDYEKAFAYFRRAIALDPGYAQAYVALGSALGRNASIFLGGAEARAQLAEAKVAVDTALRLAPGQAFTRIARGGMLINGELRWAEGVAELREAVRVAPNSAAAVGELAQALGSIGRVDEAVTLSRRALQLDPLSTSVWYWLSIALNGQGKHDEAEQAARRAIELQPASDVLHAQLAFVLDRRGKHAEAMAVARGMPPGVWRELTLAIVSQQAGDRAIAQAQGARGDADAVFAWLERAWENRDPGLRRVLYDPYLAPFRADPRFVRFLTKIGLPT